MSALALGSQTAIGSKPASTILVPDSNAVDTHSSHRLPSSCFWPDCWPHTAAQVTAAAKAKIRMVSKMRYIAMRLMIISYPARLRPVANSVYSVKARFRRNVENSVVFYGQDERNGRRSSLFSKDVKFPGRRGFDPLS